MFEDFYSVSNKFRNIKLPAMTHQRKNHGVIKHHLKIKIKVNKRRRN